MSPARLLPRGAPQAESNRATMLQMLLHSFAQGENANISKTPMIPMGRNRNIAGGGGSGGNASGTTKRTTVRITINNNALFLQHLFFILL
ncbi:hypothetical protein Leryth_007359 [Lithospermum erythrorhizon]|nr:hypothetical protein Leryth_007359 [Lithospermum erythrorhizon]